MIKTDSPSDVITSTTGTLPYPGTASFTCAFIRFYTMTPGPRVMTIFAGLLIAGDSWGRTDLGDRIYFDIFVFKTVIIKKCSYFSTKWTSIITIDFQFKSVNRRASSLLWTDIYFWCFLLNNCTFCFS